MNFLKSVARNLAPPIVVRWFRFLLKKGNSFEGNYSSWESANARCTGYDGVEIFTQVNEAALKVKIGKAKFERDGVCFHHEEYRFEVLACLMMGAAESGGELRVLDYGGALGSFYFQHRKFISRLSSLRWCIVEQKHYVDCGRKEFENEHLKFYYSTGECFKENSINIILLSSVLQYLENPFDLLIELGKQNVEYIIIDRTPFANLERNKLVIQNVPKSIFAAKLPTWIFSETEFENVMNSLGYVKDVQFLKAEERIGKVDFSGNLYIRGKS